MLDVGRLVSGDARMTQDLKQHRANLVVADESSQREYDKTVLALSGGALAVSFAFLKDILGTAPVSHTIVLLCSWLCWGASLAFLLGSHYASHLVLRKAIRQIDTKKIYVERQGGWFDIVLPVFNALSGLLFLAGVILLSLFVWFNLENLNVRPSTQSSATFATRASTL